MPRFKVLCDDQGHRFYRTVISFDRKTAMRDAVVLTYSTAIDATEVDENGIEISTKPAASEVQQGGKEVLCPFCDEKGFDKIGLKNHLINYCKDYEMTTVLP